MLYQLAAAEVDGQPYAIVAVGISNPFMVGVMCVGSVEELHAVCPAPVLVCRWRQRLSKASLLACCL